MASAGAAVVVPDDELDGARLALELGALAGSPDRLARMGEAALALGRPGATAAVATLVEQNGRRQAGKGRAGAG